MFERRHYDWLARWAGQNVGLKAAQNLSLALAADNPRFQEDRFLGAYRTHRNAARRHLQKTAVELRTSPQIWAAVDIDNIDKD